MKPKKRSKIHTLSNGYHKPMVEMLKWKLNIHFSYLLKIKHNNLFNLEHSDTSVAVISTDQVFQHTGSELNKVCCCYILNCKQSTTAASK